MAWLTNTGKFARPDMPAAKLFVVAGPVLVYGISASILYGLLLYFLGG